MRNAPFTRQFSFIFFSFEIFTNKKYRIVRGWITFEVWLYKIGYYCCELQLYQIFNQIGCNRIGAISFLLLFELFKKFSQLAHLRKFAVERSLSWLFYLLTHTHTSIVHLNRSKLTHILVKNVFIMHTHHSIYIISCMSVHTYSVEMHIEQREMENIQNLMSDVME